VNLPDAEITVVTAGPAQTEALGRAVGAALRAGDLVALEGDLGAGKTVFVRGLAEGVGADPAAVHSPTFVLHHVYPGGRVVLHHLDCYRLGPGADLDVLDLDGLLDHGAVAVEWADYSPHLAGPHAARVRIEVLGRDLRRIVSTQLPGHLAAALAAAASGSA
jgi:tRNA threonylcarbamoyladenosine biosynthesis protein TsaE